MRVHLARRALSSIGASVLLGLTLAALPMAAHAQATPPLKLSVSIQRQATGPVITITGSNFTPNGAVKLTGSPPPNTSQAIAFGPIKADASGAFSVRKEMQCTSQSQDDGFLEVTFTAIDETSVRRSTARENATPWICR
jgi:IPT/TIG domain